MNIDEQNHAELLMMQHRPVHGTTDVCRCGHNGYSTSGYLLHLYEVVERDVTERLADMPITRMIDVLFKAKDPTPWRYRGGLPPKASP
jgi:hypothetical protein